MEERLYLTALYDFYGPLLTGRQRGAFASYHINDLSLSEIAEQTGSTRQAVSDLIKRTEGILRDYEDKLTLYAKYQQKSQQAAAILKKIEKAAVFPKQNMAELTRLINELL